ncbi:MAG: ATP-binding protein [Clostridiales bacterium]|nr:ATP-binding protein [Clostridiales bacterium]
MMVHLVCGKICSGKSTFARCLAREKNAVILSCDDLSLSLFSEGLGENHDGMMRRVQAYLHERAVDIARTGTEVILEWGFWTRIDRKNAEEYYAARNISVVWHYMDISGEALRAAIEKRNARVLSGEEKSYFVDAGLFEKMDSAFETPDEKEKAGWHIVARCEA